MKAAELPVAERVLQRCEVLARCSEQADGLTRVFLSDEQRAATELAGRWMDQAGMSVRIDAIGNLVGRYEGERPGLPCLMLGSHLDTVRDAGKYDGILGVVSAIECVHSLNLRGRRLPFAIEVVGFADEEGVRFNCTLLGSRAVAGTLEPEVLDAEDAQGVSMRDALQRFGLDPAAIPAACRRREEVLAYAELHIEQGPVLEAAGLPVGIVTAISGANRLTVQIEGRAGHAGTVPMNLRRDALAAAAECVLEIERTCRAHGELVGTVGKLETWPGAVNVIPGRVRFTIDLRAPSDVVRSRALDEVKAALAAICARRQVALDLRATHEGKTAPCAPWLRKQLCAAVAAEGLPALELESGAGHDAMALIELTDIGMLFVRCKGGISHNPAEAVTAEDVAISARVLLRFIENFSPNPGTVP
jgi:allantoate deiminase